MNISIICLYFVDLLKGLFPCILALYVYLAFFLKLVALKVGWFVQLCCSLKDSLYVQT